MPPVLSEDALEALCLTLAATLLRDAVARGTRLEYEVGEEFPLEAYFGWLGEFSSG